MNANNFTLVTVSSCKSGRT